MVRPPDQLPCEDVPDVAQHRPQSDHRLPLREGRGGLTCTSFRRGGGALLRNTAISDRPMFCVSGFTCVTTNMSQRIFFGGKLTSRPFLASSGNSPVTIEVPSLKTSMPAFTWSMLVGRSKSQTRSTVSS